MRLTKTRIVCSCDFDVLHDSHCLGSTANMTAIVFGQLTQVPRSVHRHSIDTVPTAIRPILTRHGYAQVARRRYDIVLMLMDYEHSIYNASV